MANGVEYRTDAFRLNWGKEATWGVAANPVNNFSLVETATLPDPDINWRPFWAVGSGRNRSTILKGRWDLRGSVPDIEMQSSVCGPMLELVLGRTDGGIVKEGISDVDPRVPSFTLQGDALDTAGDYTFSRQYYGGKISRASFGANEGDALKLNLEEMIFRDLLQNSGNANSAKYHQVGLGTAPLNPDSSPRFTFAGASIEVGGITICHVRSINWSIDNQLNPRYYLCKAEATDTTLTQNINALQEGKRVYQIGLGIDILDPETDLTLFLFLIDQSTTQSGGAPSGTTAGFQVNATFSPEPGSGDGDLIIQCAANYSTVFPGTVVRGGKINMPAPPAGVFPGDYTMDTSEMQITLPT